MERKKVSLNNYDREFLCRKTNEMVLKFTGLEEERELIYKMYELELKIKYLIILMKSFDLKNPRVKRYHKQYELMCHNFYMKGYGFDNSSFSKNGLEVTFVKNNQKIYFFISENEFKELLTKK